MRNIKAKSYTDIPVIVSRGIIAFPASELSIDVAREFTSNAVSAAKNSDGLAVLLMQKDITAEVPSCDDMHSVGTLVKVKQFYKTKNRSTVSVSALSRVKAVRVFYDENCYRADLSVLRGSYNEEETEKIKNEFDELQKIVFEYSHLVPKAAEDLFKKIGSNDNIERTCDIISDFLIVVPDERQSILGEFNLLKRIKLIADILERDTEVLKLELEISAKVKSHLDKNQRDYYLREQIKVIQSELGEDGFQEEDEETVEYLKKLGKIPFPADIKEKLTKEIYKLEKMPFSSAEYSLLKAYIDTCLELPYGKKDVEDIDMSSAKDILDSDHFGLKKIKERILEFVAAKKYNPEYKGQILCLIGPPGVGKTSVASSVARALGHTMSRISLGGIHDEADIRGHRKTYIGAMPGRIIAAINNAKVMNPLILFDEIDKMGANSFHGDPSAALLEVLDVEQNKAFRDHFIEFPVDLSDCMFICTANTSSTIPRPLLDRMEIIELPSYTVNEKIHIAKKHLLVKQMKVHGIQNGVLDISDTALKMLIELYTKEAGVRNLEREIGKICRRCVTKMLDTDDKFININDKNLEEFAGKPKFIFEKNSSTDEIGLVNGLAWTEVGGELLQVEAAIMDGTGKLELTGSLGDVMKESAKAAVTYIRTVAEKLGIDKEFYKKNDIHLHFPDGATPKDGPSAGIAITVCLISALTSTPVDHNIAMTGEVTIRGKVLPIGGLKEKTMAAASHKIKKVLIPAENVHNIDDIDDEVKNVLEIIPVSTMDEVIKNVFKNGAFKSSASKPRTVKARSAKNSETHGAYAKETK